MTLQISEGWKIFSVQRSVPFTASIGQHNQLILVDDTGAIRAEINGLPENGRYISGDKMAIRETVYGQGGYPSGYESGPITTPLGDFDPSNWVELPSINGRGVEQTWNGFL